jgi:hypothetical protein
MNYQEIIAKLGELGVDPEKLSNEDFYARDETGAYKDQKPKIEAVLGPFRNIVEKGGEGQGEEYWTITYFEDHDVYIRVDAFYQSYDGTDFSDSKFKQVRPVRVEVTEYQAC